MNLETPLPFKPLHKLAMFLKNGLFHGQMEMKPGALLTLFH